MKNLNVTILPALIALLFFSCNKEDETMTDDQAADYVETEVSSSDGGLNEDLIRAVEITQENYANFQDDCSYSGDSTFSYQYNGVRTYDFSSTLSWTVTCQNLTVNTITFDITKSGTYEGPRLIRNGSSTGSLTISDLTNSTTYQVNGTLNSSGSAEFTGAKKTVSTTMSSTLTLTGLSVNHTTYEIESGSASMTVDASSNGNSVSKTASIDFQGGGTVVVTINGQTYTITIN